MTVATCSSGPILSSTQYRVPGEDHHRSDPSAWRWVRAREITRAVRLTNAVIMAAHASATPGGLPDSAPKATVVNCHYQQAGHVDTNTDRALPARMGAGLTGAGPSARSSADLR